MDDKDLRKQRDFDDYNRELAGASSGRIERFLSKGSPKDRIEAKRESDRRLQTQLDLLMMNPAFAAEYEAANIAIDDTQKMLNKAMSATAQNIERLTELIEDMEERTAKLPDGTAVFKTKDGQLKTADGDHLSEAETASLLNPDSTDFLSYESYKNARDALQSARARQHRYGEFQSEIDTARERVKEAKTPEELEAIKKDMEDAQDRIRQEQSMTPHFDQASAQPAEALAANLEAEMQMSIQQ